MPSKEVDVYAPVAALSSFLWMAQTRGCQQKKKRQAAMLKWFNKLPVDEQAILQRADSSLKITREVGALIQHLLMSDPGTFEKPCYLCWEMCGNGRTVKRCTRPNVELLHYRTCVDTEKALLSGTRIVWDGMTAIDISFDGIDVLSTVMALSEGMCFTVEPSEGTDVDGIMWLRCQGCFTLGQLLAAMMEWHLWKYWRSRRNVSGISSVLHPKVQSMRASLVAALANFENMRSVHSVVDKHAKSVINSLLFPSSKANDRVSLYITIMKQRLARGWYVNDITSPLALTLAHLKKLWTLCYFYSRMQHSLIPPFHTPARSKTQFTTYHLITSLLSIPLLESFTILHDARMQIRDSIIAEYHSAILCVSAGSVNCNTSGSSPPKKQPKKSKKKKSKTKSKARNPVSPVSGRSSPNDIASSSSDQLSVPCKAVFAESVAPREVSSTMIHSTQLRVDVAHIVNDLVKIAFDAISKAHPEFGDVESLTSSTGSTSISASHSHPQLPSRVSEGAPMTSEPMLPRWMLTDFCHDVVGAGSSSSNSGVLPCHSSRSRFNSLFSSQDDVQGLPAIVTIREEEIGDTDSCSHTVFDNLITLDTALKQGTPVTHSGNTMLEAGIDHNDPSNCFQGTAHHPKIQLIDEVGCSDTAEYLEYCESVSDDTLVKGRSKSDDFVGRASHDDTEHHSPDSATWDRALFEFPSSIHCENAVKSGKPIQNIETPECAIQLTEAVPHSMKGENSEGVDADSTDSRNKFSSVLNISGRLGATYEPCFSDSVRSALEVQERSLASSYSTPTPGYTRTGRTRRRATSVSISRHRQRSLSPSRNMMEDTFAHKAVYPPRPASSDRYSSHRTTISTPEESWGGIVDSEQFDTDGLSFGDSSGFGGGMDDADNLTESCDGDNQYYDRDICSHGQWFNEGDFYNQESATLALECACIRSQADSAVLRNIIALQRSIIMHPQNAGVASPNAMFSAPSYFNPHPQSSPIFPRSNMAWSRELEVMSDNGDMRRGGRIGGAATVSSLYINKTKRRSSVDDAALDKPDEKQPFVMERMTSASRSLSEAGSALSQSVGGDMTGTHPQPVSCVISNATAQPAVGDKSESLSLKATELYPTHAPIRKSSSGSIGRYELPPRSRNFGSSDSGVYPPSYAIQGQYPRRGPGYTEDYSEENASLDKLGKSSCVPSEDKRNTYGRGSQVPTESALDSTTGESVGTSKSLPENDTLPRYEPVDKPIRSGDSYASGFIVPAPHPRCTLSEFGGGLSSLLTKEILSFVAKIDMFDAKWHRYKSQAIERMRQAVQSLWPRAQVKAFGSFVSGLSLPTSDLDLVICLPKVHREAGPEAAGFLEGRNAIKETWQQNLARCLRKEAWVDVSSIKVITNTAVPVIKLRTLSEAGYCVPLDVSFEGTIHQGLEANKMNVSLMTEYPSLRPIVLVLKQFLSKRGLCEAFTGGLSSYAILLITARFLQEQPPSIPLDIGATLLGVLDFYGNHLQPAVTGISVGKRCYFSRCDNDNNSTFSQCPPLPPLPHTMAMSGVTAMARRHSYNHHMHTAFVNAAGTNGASYKPYKFDPLFIEDPLAYGNNVGRNCFRIHQVQRLWSDAYGALIEKICIMESGSEPISLLDILVGD